MEPGRPLVSVIVPAFDAEKYVSAALDSALRQTYRPIEVLVVDDGSMDGTREILSAFGDRIRVLSQEHAGTGAARNRGAAEARGAFLAFLDADDLWMQDKLERQVAYLTAHPETDLVSGRVTEFRSEELSPAAKARLFVHEGARDAILAGSMLVRRESFDRVGPFETGLLVAEFVDWYLKAKEKGLVAAMLEDVVLLRRLHTTNMGVREPGARGEYPRVLKESLDRARAQARDGASR